MIPPPQAATMSQSSDQEGVLPQHLDLNKNPHLGLLLPALDLGHTHHIGTPKTITIRHLHLRISLILCLSLMAYVTGPTHLSPVLMQIFLSLLFLLRFPLARSLLGRRTHHQSHKQPMVLIFSFLHPHQ